MSRGTQFPAPALTPEVDAVIQRWAPQRRNVPIEPQVRKRVKPIVRELVTVTEPKTPNIARLQLRYLGYFMVWADRTVGSLDPDVVNPRNASQFIEEVGKDKTLAWQAGARTALQQVGRAVNPAAWSARQRSVAAPRFSLPYSADDEDLIRLASRIPGAKNPAARLWSVAGPCGAGLRSHEATMAQVGDFHERDGRLIVAVRGSQSRLVPIRAMWTGPVREAITFVQARPHGSSQKFIIPDHPSTAAEIARKLPWGREDSVSLYRTRATWLATHLKAGTSLHVLRALAGPLSAGLLHHLLFVLDLQVTPEEAVAEGLRA